MLNTVKAELPEGFDFSTRLPTPLEIDAVRSAVLTGRLIVSDHALIEAQKDSVTLEQMYHVILNGAAISKDFPDHQSRQSGLNFEGRAGGKRVVRLKVSWQDGYYLVTVHTVQQIRVKRGGRR